MKRILILCAVFLVGVWGCNNQDSVLEPNQPSNQAQTIQFISLPNILEKSDNGNSLFDSQIINGKNGGELETEFSNSWLEIKAKLTVPENAFDGTKKLTMQVSRNSTSVDFGPSGTVFQNSCKLDLEYKGLNLKNVNPNNVIFAYIDNSGNVTKIQYDALIIDKQNKVLKVVGAEINHFSRFGFCL